ncbi:unnamed protein product [Diatraea saccharalis]|uniref:Nucleolar protein 6 n=1 Tax=Diatraea saccharalis TaxID=40085 RepID=A0A9N9R6V8_9NEOP|nr:unnamed protein product [Diatraea saccharalis]
MFGRACGRSADQLAAVSVAILPAYLNPHSPCQTSSYVKLHQRHPSFGAACCLLKRWLCCQLLAPPHFPAACAELLAAAAYAAPAPAPRPTRPARALHAAWRLLADTDWANDALVLDFHGDMKREDITAIESEYSSRADRSPRLHIVTSLDGPAPGARYPSPSPLVLARAVSLARSALHYGAFVPSYEGYDVLIHLHKNLVPYAHERVDATPLLRTLADPDEAEVIPVVAYDEFALFFHDSYGGDVIAVLWKPDIHNLREFQLTNANALMPVNVDGETKYKVNIDALVEDFRILGEGLVDHVTHK